MGKFGTLERAPLTENWNLEERSALAHFLEEKKIREGSFLTLPKTQDRGLYFLDSGSIRVAYENISHELKPGDSVGELSLILATPKSVTITASRESLFWYLSLENFAQLKRSSPIIAQRLCEAILHKVGRLLADAPLPTRLMGSSSSPSANKPNL